jgi:hypothetical protein
MVEINDLKTDINNIMDFTDHIDGNSVDKVISNLMRLRDKLHTDGVDTSNAGNTNCYVTDSFDKFEVSLGVK